MAEIKITYEDESGDSFRAWMSELKEAFITVKREGKQITIILPPKQTRQLRDLLITNCDNSGEPKQIDGVVHYFLCRECYKRFDRKADAQQCCGFGIGYYCKTCRYDFTVFEKPQDHFKDGKCPKELDATNDTALP